MDNKFDANNWFVEEQKPLEQASSQNIDDLNIPPMVDTSTMISVKTINLILGIGNIISSIVCFVMAYVCFDEYEEFIGVMLGIVGVAMLVFGVVACILNKNKKMAQAIAIETVIVMIVSMLCLGYEPMGDFF